MSSITIMVTRLKEKDVNYLNRFESGASVSLVKENIKG
jgi:hypothetical protein